MLKAGVCGSPWGGDVIGVGIALCRRIAYICILFDFHNSLDTRYVLVSSANSSLLSVYNR